jgi:hypothetical protein
MKTTGDSGFTQNSSIANDLTGDLQGPGASGSQILRTAPNTTRVEEKSVKGIHYLDPYMPLGPYGCEYMLGSEMSWTGSRIRQYIRMSELSEIVNDVAFLGSKELSCGGYVCELSVSTSQQCPDMKIGL